MFGLPVDGVLSTCIDGFKEVSKVLHSGKDEGGFLIMHIKVGRIKGTPQPFSLAKGL